MFRPYSGESHRHAYLVIEVALGFKHIQLLAEYPPYHFLGSSLADAAGNAHHRQIQALPVGGDDRLQGSLHIIRQNDRALSSLRRSLCQTAGGALGKGCGDIVVAVRPFSPVCHKHVPRLYGSAVNYDPSYLCVLCAFSNYTSAAQLGGSLNAHFFHTIISDSTEYITQLPNNQKHFVL